MRSLALAAVIGVLTLAVPFTAQHSVGTISGVVKDSAGAAIPGATVQITARGIAPITQVSDSSGAFTFERVPTADYEITVTLAGFKRFTSRISVKQDKTTRFDIVLQVGGITETVTVAAEAATVMTQSAQRAERGGKNRNGAVDMAAPAPAPAPPSQGGRDYMTFLPRPVPNFNTEADDRIDDNSFRRVTDEPLSTFSIDVDTASYANVRRFLNERHAAADGRRPDRGD